MTLKKSRIALSITVAAFLTSGFAQSFQWTMDAGVSRANRTAGEWGYGFSAGTNIFLIAHEHLLVGGRLAYNRWEPDPTKIEVVYGASSILEIVPAVRITTARDFEFANYFLQGGAGVYIHRSNLYPLNSSSGDRESSLRDVSEQRFGISVGGGVALGDVNFMTLELLPLYHMLFNETETLRYFSAGLGLSFRF